MGQVNILGQMLQNNVVRLINGEFVDKDNLVISGVPATTWATFIGAGFDLTRARHVIISDRKIRPNGGYPLFFIDPAATTQKRILQSRTLYVDTFATLLASYPAASWPWLTVYLGDLNIEVYSNGTRYKPVGGTAILAGETFGTLASPTNTLSATGMFPITAPALPAGLLALGDRLRLSARFRKTGAVAVYHARAVLGTTADVANAMIWEATSAAVTTGYDLNCDSMAMVGSATSFNTNRANILAGSGAAPASFDATANFNVASAMTLGIWIGALTSTDTAALIGYTFRWEA